MIRIISSTDRAALERLIARRSRGDRAFDRQVQTIVERVRKGGDRALLAFARRFDGIRPPLEVGVDEMQEQATRVPADVRRAIRQAARNIARVAFRQIPKHWDLEVVPGVSIEQRIEPIARVGCYVPGGRYPLPSSLLMTAIPAAAAGVTDVIAVCPRPEPVVMAAALEAGVSRLFRIGGAHAIAAMAYGTETVPRVDKIVGPGNRWVAEAKALVSGDCAIDFYAGPTEIVVVAGSGRARWWAADLIAQAEHDPEARSLFITWRPAFAERVAKEVDALANRLAPEHLVVDTEALIERPITAGAVFVGPFTAQAAGDYATGSNHVLPTSGAARFRGGLNAADYVRVMAVQRLSQKGLRALAPSIVALARAEGLDGHAESIEARLS